MSDLRFKLNLSVNNGSNLNFTNKVLILNFSNVRRFSFIFAVATVCVTPQSDSVQSSIVVACAKMSWYFVRFLTNLFRYVRPKAAMMHFVLKNKSHNRILKENLSKTEAGRNKILKASSFNHFQIIYQSWLLWMNESEAEGTQRADESCSL